MVEDENTKVLDNGIIVYYVNPHSAITRECAKRIAEIIDEEIMQQLLNDPSMLR